MKKQTREENKIKQDRHHNARPKENDQSSSRTENKIM